MWLILLSLLAIESIQSATIGYPYRSVWAYNPQKSDSIHGYLRSLDNSGYNSPQPAYAVKQIKHVDSGAATAESSKEIIKAREIYLRAASLQQYQNLKADIDVLRGEGKEPAAEKLLKLQMLEKIAFTSDFSLIADLPEVKSTLQDLEANISGLYKESVQQTSNQQANAAQNSGEIKTYVGNSHIPQVAIEETAEQKQVRENHLRIYNEQIAHLKQLELDHQKYVQQASTKANIPQAQIENKPSVELTDNAKALAELKRAQEEHFRLWNEAKLRAEEAGYGDGEKGVYVTADKQQISAVNNDQNIYNPKQNIPNQLATQRAQRPGESNKQFEQQSTIPNLENAAQTFNDQIKLKDGRSQISGQQHVADTPEVVPAREEHLRFVNEVSVRGQTVAESGQKQSSFSDSKATLGQEALKADSQSSKNSFSELNYRPEQTSVQETLEVKKAREEHLRLVHEANLRAQFVEQQELKYKHKSQTPILKSQYEHQQLVYHPENSQNTQETQEAVEAREGNFNVANKANEHNEKLVPSQTFESQITGETAEVQRAREEHLRIFNAIKSHAEEEQAKQNSRAFPQPTSTQTPTSDYLNEEERLLELERSREAERLQKEQQLLELDRLREAERLAEEKRQMTIELTRLRLEEEQRLEMERLLEEKRLQQEQEYLRKLQNGEYQEIVIQSDSVEQQPQITIESITNVEQQARSQQNKEVETQQSQEYANNPFLKDGQTLSKPVNPQEPSLSQQSLFLKNIPAQVPSNTYQHNSFTSPHQPHHSDKHQYVKYNYHDAASTQPADTAVALIALEKATNEHFRAHELVLEQLRLARLQNSSIKDCNGET